jgi:small subunit ribosomal protein S18
MPYEPRERNNGDRTERNNDNPRPHGANRRRRKVCKFCLDKAQSIDYKDVEKLRRFLSERSKILPRRTTGVCAPHQRQLMAAIKRARIVALLPYVTD